MGFTRRTMRTFRATFLDSTGCPNIFVWCFSETSNRRYPGDRPIESSAASSPRHVDAMRIASATRRASAARCAARVDRVRADRSRRGRATTRDVERRATRIGGGGERWEFQARARRARENGRARGEGGKEIATRTSRAGALGAGESFDEEAARARRAATKAAANRGLELWWRAVKLPMYAVAWIPLLCAAALTYCQFGFVDWRHAGTLAAGATATVAWLNLSNDAFDSETNVDARKPESIVRLMDGNVRAVHAIAIGCLVGGAAALWSACEASGNPTSWRALVAAVALGYAYQGPPFRLSYKGLGEPLCFTAFGPLATVAFYIAMAGKAAGGAAVTVPAIVASVAILLGCTTAFILFTSHFHQEQGDRAAGKLSPVVRLGLPGALLVADNLIGAHYATIATLAAAGWLPYTAVFGLIITYPLARHIVDFAQDRADAGAIEDLFYTKYLAVRYHVVHGVLLALGVVAQRAFLSPDLFFAPL